MNYEKIITISSQNITNIITIEKIKPNLSELGNGAHICEIKNCNLEMDHMIKIKGRLYGICDLHYKQYIL